MINVGKRRAIIKSLIKKAREESLIQGKSLDTIDPILRVGRRLYPFFSENDLHEAACTALRVIKLRNQDSNCQTTLLSYP